VVVDGETLTLPWRVDARAAEIARDRHDIPFSEILQAVDRVVGGGVDQEVLEEYGIEGPEDLEALSDEERQEIAQKAHVEGRDVGEVLETAALLLWIGFVRFEPSLTPERAYSLVDASTVAPLPLGDMVGRIIPSADESDVATAEGGEDGGEGK